MTSTEPFPSYPLSDYRARQAAIDAAVMRVLASGLYVLGPEVETFETELAASIGEGLHAVGTSSGTAAIILAIQALGLEAGDVVIAPAHTAVATIAAIEIAGATPLLVDIDPATFNIDPQAVLAALATPAGRRARVLLPVHLYGLPADMPTLASIARAHGLRVVEDCAQAQGASLHGRPVGTWGDIATFSFYPTKNLAALGDAGAVVTPDAAVAMRLRELRQYGWRERQVSATTGRNCRLDELQAAVLRVKLPHLAAANARRRTLAAYYSRGIEPLRDFGVVPPTGADGAESVFHQYVIRTPRRDAVRAALAAAGVPTGVHYPVPVHRQPAYSGRPALLAAAGAPESERAAIEVLSLPMHPHLSDDAVELALARLHAIVSADA